MPFDRLRANGSFPFMLSLSKHEATIYGRMMGFRENYDKLIEAIATEDKADDILRAKEEFWKLTGKMHGGEHLFETRMMAFFDWYIFDRKINGRTPMEQFLSHGLPEGSGKKDIYQGFLQNVHSIFVVKRITPGRMKIKNLLTKKVYCLDGEDVSLGFYKSAVFEGRLLAYKKGFHFTPALCFHPGDAKKIIRYMLKLARKAGKPDILPLIHKLSYMNLKWETYRNIKVKDIYKFEEYEKRSWWHF